VIDFSDAAKLTQKLGGTHVSNARDSRDIVSTVPSDRFKVRQLIGIDSELVTNISLSNLVNPLPLGHVQDTHSIVIRN